MKLIFEAGTYCQAKAVPTVRRFYRDIVFEMFSEGLHELEQQVETLDEVPEELQAELIEKRAMRAKFLVYQILADSREMLFQMAFQGRAITGLRMIEQGKGSKPLEEGCVADSIDWGMQKLAYLLSEYLQNQHTYTSIVALFGEEMGLFDTGAEDDVLAQRSGNSVKVWLLNKLFEYKFGYSLKKIFEIGFFYEYTAHIMPDYLMESLAHENRGISELIMDWMKGWAKERDLDEEEVVRNALDIMHWEESEELKLLQAEQARAMALKGAIVEELTEIEEERIQPLEKRIWRYQRDFLDTHSEQKTEMYQTLEQRLIGVEENYQDLQTRLERLRTELDETIKLTNQELDRLADDSCKQGKTHPQLIRGEVRKRGITSKALQQLDTRKQAINQGIEQCNERKEEAEKAIGLIASEMANEMESIEVPEQLKQELVEMTRDRKESQERIQIKDKEIEAIKSQIRQEENRLKEPGERAMLLRLLTDMRVIRIATEEDREENQVQLEEFVQFAAKWNEFGDAVVT